MATGGRVRHHLKHNLWRAESSVVFVGYAAAGTLARRIIDGARQVEVLGEQIPVRARIYTISGFSGHADQAELMAWHKATAARRTFLVHGEQPAMQKLAAQIGGGAIEMPTPHQEFEL
jgi:metallo-beta-lactamase family protein